MSKREQSSQEVGQSVIHCKDTTHDYLPHAKVLDNEKFSGYMPTSHNIMLTSQNIISC